MHIMANIRIKSRLGIESVEVAFAGMLYLTEWVMKRGDERDTENQLSWLDFEGIECTTISDLRRALKASSTWTITYLLLLSAEVVGDPAAKDDRHQGAAVPPQPTLMQGPAQTAHLREMWQKAI